MESPKFPYPYVAENDGDNRFRTGSGNNVDFVQRKNGQNSSNAFQSSKYFTSSNGAKSYKTGEMGQTLFKCSHKVNCQKTY